MKQLQFAAEFGCVLLAALLLSGCAGPAGMGPAAGSADSDPRPAALVSEETPQESVFVEAPDSPYPLVEQEWTVDMDRDGVEELVQLRAEKAYVGNETEPVQWLETTDGGLHPYTLLVTKGETVYELPLGRESNNAPILHPWYFSVRSSEYTGACWTADQEGAPVLALWFDTISGGGAGRVEVYAAAFRDGGPILLPVPEFGMEAVLDKETLIAQVTVPETGYTQELDLNLWLESRDPPQKPHCNEDGSLEWPVAPGSIDEPCFVEAAEAGISLRQYVWGIAHADGMGYLVTTLNWENGNPVVMDQYFDWGFDS